MDIQATNKEIFPFKSEPTRSATLESIQNDAIVSSLAYMNLVIFVAILLCYSGMSAIAGMFYALSAFILFTVTAIVAIAYNKNQSNSIFSSALVLVTIVNDLAIPAVLVFDYFAAERANTLASIITVVSVSFISVHLSARFSLAMVSAKTITFLFCGIFIFLHPIYPLPETEVLSLLLISCLIVMGTGYWLILRRRQEFQLRFELERLNAYSENQNMMLSDVLEENSKTSSLLKEQFDFRRKLVSHIGHDLRQPISAAVYMLLEMAKYDNTKEQDVLIQDTSDCVRSASRMIEDIVQFTHFENMHIEMQPQLVSLDDVIVKIVRECQGQASEALCEIGSAFSSVKVVTDPDLLERILRNLTVNALKHSDATKLLLGVRRKQLGAEVWVVDNGCGLHAGQTALVTRVAGNQSAGLGLGIRISEQLAQTIGAELIFTSGDGEGTTARLIFSQAH